MDTETKPSKIHPLTAAAAIAVILVSITGVAAMTGILPGFNKTPDAEVVGNAATGTDLNADVPASQPAGMPLNQAANQAPTESSTPVKKTSTRKYAPSAGNVASYSQQDAQQQQQQQAPMPSAPMAPPPCPDCGVVESVRSLRQQAPVSGLGAAAGAVLGGVLGHQVGGGNGRTLATIAGAVGGGFAGNAVEDNVKTKTSYEVLVRMEDGSRQRFMMDVQRWRSGDQVRVQGGELVSRQQ